MAAHEQAATADGPAGWIPRLNLRHLQLLTRLAELKSISDAARAMSTTQPALSKWLRELEEDIGAPLFERRVRGLEPTEHGQVLLTHARRALNEMQRARDNLAALHGSRSRKVLLGSTPSSTTALVPLAIARFLQRHPQAHVELCERTMGTLLQRLERGELDVIVGSLDGLPPSDAVHSERLHSEPLKVIARAGHPLAARKRLSWDDLYAYGWVLWPRDTVNRSKLDAALAHAGRGPLPCRVESSSMLANMTLTERTDLLCAVSNRLARHFAERLQLVTLNFSLDVETPIGMCWREQPLQEASTLDLLQSLRETAQLLGRKSANGR